MVKSGFETTDQTVSIQMDARRILILVLTAAILAAAGIVLFGGKTKIVVTTQKISQPSPPMISGPQPYIVISAPETKTEIQPEIQPAQKEVQPVVPPQK